MKDSLYLLSPNVLIKNRESNYLSWWAPLVETVNYTKTLWDLICKKNFLYPCNAKINDFLYQGGPTDYWIIMFLQLSKEGWAFFVTDFCLLELFSEVWWAPSGGRPQGIAVMPIGVVRACMLVTMDWLFAGEQKILGNMLLTMVWLSRGAENYWGHAHVWPIDHGVALEGSGEVLGICSWLWCWLGGK